MNYCYCIIKYFALIIAHFLFRLAMTTFCAANCCTNNSDKGYSVFNFLSNEELRKKWIAALGKGSNWRSTFQRICEVSDKN